MNRRTRRVVAWSLFAPPAAVLAILFLYALGWVVYRAWVGETGAQVVLGAAVFVMMLVGGAAMLIELDPKDP